MNYRTILLASAAVMVASAASAKDITNPFYLPGQGEMLSNTSVEYNRMNLKHGLGNVDEGLYANEEISYGINDNLSVVGAIGNHFDSKGMTNRDYNNEHNFDYSLGAKYNMQSGNWLGQLGANYYTYNPKSWDGHRDNDERWYKELNATAKIGYDLGNGWTPYSSFTLLSPIDQANRTMEYSWFNGVHKKADKYAFNAGVRYDFNTDGDWDLLNDGRHKHNKNVWYAQADAYYFLKDNVALGVYGDYYLGGNYNDLVDYDYTAGVNAKVLF